MSIGNSASLDILAKKGVLGFDAHAYLMDNVIVPPGARYMPNNYQHNMNGINYPQLNTPQQGVVAPEIKDIYTKATEKEPENSSIKKFATAALFLYIAGYIASKGKLNPIEGIKALGKGVAKTFSAVVNFFKKL